MKKNTKKFINIVNTIVFLGLFLFFLGISVYNGEILFCKETSAAEKGVEIRDIETCKFFNIYTPGLVIPHNKGGLMLIGNYFYEIIGLILAAVMLIVFLLIRKYLKNKHAQSNSH